MFRVRQSIFSLIPVILVLGMVGSAFSQQSTSDATERRIDALLKQMTLEEKVGQLAQYTSNTPQTLELVRQGKVGSLFNVLGAADVNAAQKLAVEKTRLKIPLIFGLDVIHGYRTVFPVPIAGACSFDPELIEQSERVAAKEASAAGIKWTFAPMVDISRDPRWGRMVEGAGEDPYLSSVVGAARVRGFQGKSIADPDSVAACTKHYVAYGAVEGGRDYNTVDISEALLREVYLPPFHAAVKAGSATMMSAFEDLNGVPSTVNHHTLTDILRNEWGFNGFVVSDYGAVDELLPHGVAKDEADAARLALTAGVDMDMADGAYGKQLGPLVESGKVPMSVLDEAVRRVLRVKFQAGLFENPYTDPQREGKDILTTESVQLARKMAQESIVLLKNQNNLLPLDKNTKMIAVIGPLANDKADQMGSWVAQGRAADAVAPLEGIKAQLPHVQLLYAKGVDLDYFGKPASIGAPVAAPAPSTATGVADVSASAGANGIDDAVQAAQKADVVILFLGELAGMTGEASSRASLDLPGKQQQLLEAIVATGKPVVLVLESGRPLNILWANDHVPAIVQAWYPGVQSGNAIADILFGDVSPSARLAISWPRSVGQIPVYYDHKNTGRPTSPDRWHTGYLDESKEPLFPFGYGLTYTSFQYSDLQVTTPDLMATGTLRVTADVKNAGQRVATEVVQFYVHDRVAPTSRPVRELKGFSRITLSPGEHKTVEFSVDAKDLGSYDPSMNWIVPPGAYDVWIAPNAIEGVQGEFQISAK
ncbi:MAG TPA: beta-glucosidase BglX [Terriglobales bacterium]|nr:beta-glucosidase BglX [Terriglobales bacterium]